MRHSVRRLLPYFPFLSGCCLLLAVSVGICINAYGVFITPTSEALHISRGQLSFHATLSALATGLFSPFAIRLIQKYHLKTFCLLGTIGTALSTWLMSFAQSALLFDLLGLIRGISLSFFSMAALTTAINQWFLSGRSIVTGICMAFSGIAGAVLSPVLSRLIEAYGYAATYRITALFILVLALPSALFCIGDRPAEKDLTPYQERERQQGIKQSSLLFPLKLHSPTFIILGIWAFLVTMATSLTQHITGYAISISYSLSEGSVLLSFVMIGNIASKLLIGFVSEKFGAVPSCLYMLLLSIAGLLMLLLFPTSMALLCIGSLLFGFVYSISAVGISNVVFYLYGNKNYGSAYAIVSMLTCIGSALSLTLFGFLYDLTGSYKPSIYFCIVLILFGELLALLLQKRANNQKG